MRPSRLPHRYWLLLFLLALPVLLAACQAGGGGSGGALPGEGRLYFAAPQGRVYALDPDSRSRGLPFPAPGEWVSPVEGKGLGTLYAPPVADGQVLYLATFKGEVLVLNAESGAAKGDKPLFKGDAIRDAIAAAPLLVSGALLVASGNRLYALDPATGAQRWVFSAGNRLWSQPFLAGDKVVVGSLDRNLYALDLASGREVWRFGTGGSIASTPAWGDGIIFVGSFDRRFYALAALDGKPAWSFPAKGWIWNRPLYHQGGVYLGDLEGVFYALDARSGEERWRYSLEGGVRAAPVLVQDTLVVATSQGWVYGLSPLDGPQVRWRFPPGEKPRAGVIADLVAAEGTVYVPYQDGRLYALEAASGRVEWSFPK